MPQPEANVPMSVQAAALPNPVPVLIMLFVMSRLVILLVPPPDSDVEGYARYAIQFSQAMKEHESLYAIHRDAQLAEADAARKNGKELLAQEQAQLATVEYPALAIAVMVVPDMLLQVEPGAADRADFVRQYKSLFRMAMLILDCLLFFFVIEWTRRLFPAEDAWTRGKRLAIYVLGGAVLWPIWYDRLDLVMTFLLIAALLLLIGQRNYLWSFLVLAVAINFKIIPLVAAPVWLLGSLPVRAVIDWKAGQRIPLVVGLLWRMGLLAAFVIGVFLPFYLVAGPETLSFVDFHRARGIEIESVFASLLMLLQACGHPLHVYGGYGCINVTADLAPLLVQLSTWILAAGLLITTGLLVVVLYRRARTEGATAGPGLSLAQARPQTCCAFCLLFLAVALSASKVLSPQYLVALVPLTALLPFDRGSNRLLWIIFLGMCLLTTYIFPFLFWTDLAGVISGGDRLFAGPTLLGASVLGLRNLLLLGFTCMLAFSLARRR